MSGNLPKLDVKVDVSDSANEVIKNALSAPAKSTGRIATTTLDFIHNTVLLPMQRYNLYSEAKTEEFKSKLNERIAQIPEEKLVEPSMNILGPALEGLKYNLDEEHIKEMFMNIFLADMNADTKSKVLPAYAEIVRQLSVNDAEFLKTLFAEIVIDIFEIKQMYSLYFCDDMFSSVDGIEDIKIGDYTFSVLKYKPYDKLNDIVIDNLERLKIIKKCHPNYFTGGTSSLTHEEIFVEIKNKYELNNEVTEDIEIKITYERKAIMFTAFGKNFAEICLRDEENENELD